MGARESKNPEIPPQQQMSEAEVTRLKTQKKQCEREWQQKVFTASQIHLLEVAEIATALWRDQNEEVIAAQKKLQEVENLVAQKKLLEESLVAAQKQLQEDAAKFSAQKKLQEEVLVAVQKKLQEEATNLATQRRNQEVALITARRKLLEETAKQEKIEAEAAKSAQQNEAVQRAQQEEAARTAQQEEAIRRAQQEATAKRAQQEASTKRAQQEEAARRAQRQAAAQRKQQEASAKRAQQEEAVRRARQEAAAQRAQQEEAARRAQQEAVVRRARQEAAAQRAQQEEAARRAQQEAAAQRAQQEEAVRRARQEAAAQRVQQEEAARRAQQEAAAQRAQQEEATNRTCIEEAANLAALKKLQQEKAAKKALHEEAAKRAQNEATAMRKLEKDTPSRTHNLPKEADVLRWCATCFTRSTMEMFECQNGHGSCFRCKIREDSECGICQSDLTDRRSYDFDNHVAQTKVPCPHESKGCVLSLRIADMKIHMKECPFKKQDCPLAASHFPKCQWKGETSELWSHFSDMHRKNQLCSSLVGEEMQVNTIHGNGRRYVRLVKLGFYFIFHLKISKIQNKVFIAVQLIGTKRSAEKWLYEIHVYDKSDNSRKFMHTDNCRSSIDDIEDVFEAGECAVLPMRYANTFINNGVLTFKFFIKRTKETNGRSTSAERNQRSNNDFEGEEEVIDISRSKTSLVEHTRYTRQQPRAWRNSGLPPTQPIKKKKERRN